MATCICVLKKRNVEEPIIGYISCESILAIRNAAQKLDLKCLSFIYFIGDAYFNTKQAQQIKKEIALLRNYPTLKETPALDIIEQAVDEVLKYNDRYLEFLGD